MICARLNRVSQSKQSYLKHRLGLAGLHRIWGTRKHGRLLCAFNPIWQLSNSKRPYPPKATNSTYPKTATYGATHRLTRQPMESALAKASEHQYLTPRPPVVGLRLFSWQDLACDDFPLEANLKRVPSREHQNIITKICGYGSKSKSYPQ